MLISDRRDSRCCPNEQTTARELPNAAQRMKCLPLPPLHHLKHHNREEAYKEYMTQNNQNADPFARSTKTLTQEPHFFKTCQVRIPIPIRTSRYANATI